jgi:hypothetical protein
MDDTVKAFETSHVDFASIRIPEHFTQTGFFPNQAEDLMTLTDQVPKYRRSNQSI